MHGDIPTKRVTIDSVGRLVVPKPLRDELGFTAGTELEIRAVDGHLEISVPSRVRIEDGPYSVRFAADTDEKLSPELVRELTERGRR